MQFSDWNPEDVAKLRADKKHLVWLDHEARYHQDPETQRIIAEIRDMIQPTLYVDIQFKISALYKALHNLIDRPEPVNETSLERWDRLDARDPDRD